MSPRWNTAKAPPLPPPLCEGGAQRARSNECTPVVATTPVAAGGAGAADFFAFFIDWRVALRTRAVILERLSVATALPSSSNCCRLLILTVLRYLRGTPAQATGLGAS